MNCIPGRITAFTVFVCFNLACCGPGGDEPAREYHNYVYVANATSDTVSGFSIKIDGTLTELAGSPYAAGASPRSMAMTSAGKFVYVPNPNQIWAYTVSAGVLNRMSGAPFTFRSAAPPMPHDIALDPGGRHAYTANENTSDVSVFAINETTGVLAEIAGSPFPAGSGAYEVEIDPTGKFVYVANIYSENISVFNRDAATGALAEIAGSPFATGSAPYSMDLAPSGKFLYAANSNEGSISGFAVHATTGALTEIAGSPFLSVSWPTSITVGPAGALAYVTDGNLNTISVCRIDAATGALAEIAGSPFEAGFFPSHMAFGPSGDYAYVAEVVDMGLGGVTVYDVDKATGAVTKIEGSSKTTGLSACHVLVARILE